MSNEFDHPTDLMRALDKAMRDQRWKTTLASFLPMGLATIRHVQDVTGFPRDKASRCIDQLQGFFLAGSPLISCHPNALRTPGGSKRPSTIFLLSMGGSQLLQHLGMDARACDLKEETAILHAVCMASIAHLAERQSDLQVITDKNIPHGNGKLIRPDHQVILSQGRSYLIEIEQQANPKLLPRIMESLSNKQAFFKSKESVGVQNVIRMLLNVKPGKDFHKTVKVWKEAMRLVMQTNGQELGFSIIVLPFHVFLSSPEWDEQLSERWQRIDPNNSTNDSSAIEQKSLMPSAKRSNRSLEKDIVLLSALAQDFDETIPFEQRDPDWNMPHLVRTIYEAVHGKDHCTFNEVAGMPLISIYLLREYLNLHPELLTRLRQAIHFNKTKVVWTQQNILHRMRIVISTFLAYHGWRSSHVIKIYPTIDGDGKGDYTVKCVWESTPSRYRGQYREITDALQWVLWALFEYAEDLGLGRPEFW